MHVNPILLRDLLDPLTLTVAKSCLTILVNSFRQKSSWEHILQGNDHKNIYYHQFCKIVLHFLVMVKSIKDPDDNF